MTDNSEKKVHSINSPDAPFIVKSGVGTPSAPDTPFVFATPHSGRHYPNSLIEQTTLDAHRLRASEDAWVDELFVNAPKAGATQLFATYGRSYVDLNRAADELDPAMFTPTLQEEMVRDSHRVKAGLGVIPKLVAPGEPIYGHQLPAREATKRLNDVYHAYHDKLKNLMGARQARFNHAILIDCHSMPSHNDTNDTNQNKQSRLGTKRRLISGLGRRRGAQEAADIVLGDLWGASCDSLITSTVEKLLINEGFKVIRNIPYAGGYATQHYGRPKQGFHAIQIEINRALYMNEETLEPNRHFKEIQRRLTRFSTALIQEYRQSLPLAAE
jgi:N-formylglutamate amidohydrolase